MGVKCVDCNMTDLTGVTLFVKNRGRVPFSLAQEISSFFGLRRNGEEKRR